MFRKADDITFFLHCSWGICFRLKPYVRNILLYCVYLENWIILLWVFTQIVHSK